MRGMKHIAEILRDLMPMPARRFLGRLGVFFGRGVPSVALLPDLRTSLESLRGRGYQAAVAVDVGAYEGEWTNGFLSVFPTAKVVMIEPQRSKRAVLDSVIRQRGESVSIESTLLGAESGREVSFAEMETGSSVFHERSRYNRLFVPMVTQRLDDVLARAGGPPVDFLKLDVQGYELEVLKGAPETLRQTAFVLLEASLLRVNEGCPLLSDVVGFMSDAGFQLYDICGQSRMRDGVLWQMDLLFVRKDSAWVPRAELTRENWA